MLSILQDGGWSGLPARRRCALCCGPAACTSALSAPQGAHAHHLIPPCLTSGVVHGDLKAPNVLLTSVGGGVGGARVRAKLADFGLSKMLPGTHEAVQRTTVVGTVQYMSPELLETGRLTRACDVYGFGILSESLLRRHDLWRSSTRSATYSPCPAPPPPSVGGLDRRAGLCRPHRRRLLLRGGARAPAPAGAARLPPGLCAAHAGLLAGRAGCEVHHPAGVGCAAGGRGCAGGAERRRDSA